MNAELSDGTALALECPQEGVMNLAIRDKLDGVGSNIQTSMQINPMKWAGIAAGVGFSLGLVGRLLQRRAKRNLPELIVIETV